MPKCDSCRQKFGFLELRDGMCKTCRDRTAEEIRAAEDTAHRAKLAATGNIRTGDIPTHIIDEQAAGIIVTTCGEIPGSEIEKIVDVIGSESALGLNVFKDIANNWRDFFGGRSTTVQIALKDARSACLVELRREALAVGADAVIGLKMDYSELSTSGTGGILFVAATGTAVRLRQP